MAEAPLVCLLDDIQPNDPLTSGPLTYSNLAPAALRYEKADGAFMSDIWNPDQSPIQQLHSARNTASAYLVRAACQLTSASTPEQHSLWSKRFTRASIDLFGEPDPAEARRLIHTKQRRLLRLQSNNAVDQSLVNTLLEFYSSVAGEPDMAAPDTDIEINHEVAQLITERFGPVLEILDNTAVGRDVLTTEEFSAVFAAAIKWLAENNNPEWATWKIRVRPGGFAVYQETKEIIIGANPAGATRLRVRTLLAHELLIHVLGSVNANRYGDRNLELGLPGFDPFEEGKASLVGWAVSGSASSGAIDFYSDIALALGSIDDQPRSREELLIISNARAIVRAQAEADDQPPTDSVIKRLSLTANQTINRIFRGGGLFTKDIVYYHGYKQADSFIKRKRAEGISIGRIFDYLLLGGFDPTIDLHRDHVQRVTGQTL
jgi:hypothetical protein